MNLYSQLLQVIDLIAQEEMWRTLEEYEVISFNINDTKIYTSFLGKNVPYYGIELFIGDEGERALIERLNAQYYPEYSYRYRQNSIMIFIDSKLPNDKLNETVIKKYEVNKQPKILPEIDYLFVLDCLGKVYDAIKIMQSQNLLGKLKENHYIHYENYSITQKLLHKKVDYPVFTGLFAIPDKKTDYHLEIDYIPMEVTLTSQEIAFAIIAVCNKKIVFNEMVLENPLYKLAQAIQFLLHKYGRFKKIRVRSQEVKTYLTTLTTEIDTEICYHLREIDAIVEKLLEEENHDKK